MKKRFEYILYTLRHKRAFLHVEKQLRGKNTLHGYLHDIDKIFLYLFCFWMDLDQIQNFHRKHNCHHVNNKLKKNDENRLDTIIDWECARQTKKDKPLNAYQTLVSHYPDYKKLYMPIIQKYLPHQIPKNK